MWLPLMAKLACTLHQQPPGQDLPLLETTSTTGTERFLGHLDSVLAVDKPDCIISIFLFEKVVRDDARIQRLIRLAQQRVCSALDSTVLH